MEFNYRDELKKSLREKKSKNNGYSLRAFARDLGVSSTALSDVLSGKRNFSQKNAQKISERLCFSPEQYKVMLKEIKRQTLDFNVQCEVVQIKEDEFNLISNWYFLAVLTLSEQRNVKACFKTIGVRLGIKPHLAKKAIDTLIRLNFIEVRNKKLKRTSHSIRTTSDIPSYAIRNYHKENLEVIKYNLDNTDVTLREVTSMNLNIDPKKLKKAKKMINKFKEDFTVEMEKTSPKEVYTLAMHFFPASLNKDLK